MHFGSPLKKFADFPVARPIPSWGSVGWLVIPAARVDFFDDVRRSIGRGVTPI